MEDLYNILKNNSQVFTSVDSHYPNIDGYKLISREIIDAVMVTLGQILYCI